MNPMTIADGIVTRLAQLAVKRGVKPIFLKWKGSKVPRGHSVDGVEIGWTQHGVVTGVNGQMLGTYERISEWSGENKDEHEMMIVPMPPE